MWNDIGRLILRLCLGVLILLHGVAKLVHGIDAVQGMVSAAGLPPLFAYGVYVGEVIGPLLVLSGFYARVGAALIAFNMLVAISLAHTGELLQLTAFGGWQLELQGMYLFTAIAVALLGPGAFSFNRR